MPQPTIPASLTPGRQRPRPSWDRSNLHSTGVAPYVSPYISSPNHTSLYGDYFFSPPPLPPPPVPHKRLVVGSPLQPLPPKPTAVNVASPPRNPLYPQSIPVPVAGPSSQPIEPEPRQASPVDDKDIALAMALSASEARRHEEELLAQEEEELLRALEESRMLSSVYSVEEGPSAPLASTSFRSLPVNPVLGTRSAAHPPEGESWLQLTTPTASQDSRYDEASFSRAPEEDNELAGPADEEFFRLTNSESLRPTTVDTREFQSVPDTGPPTPPLYAGVVNNLIKKPNSTPPTSHSSVPSNPTLSPPTGSPPQSTQSLGPDGAQYSASLSQTSLGETHAPSPIPSSSPRQNRSLSGTSDGSVLTGRAMNSEVVSSVSTNMSPPATPGSPNLSFASSTSLDPLDEGVEEEERVQGPSRPTVPLSANQYVEPEMLMGVSLGFSRPMISTELTPMTGMMPNVITLPYGKGPAFHFQAPSWRRLLKLMARLSATRVEPTLEALAVAKHELKLRTVIQFVKIHHSASEWRAVLYLTTDHPVPPSTLTSHKYMNGDVNTLPYSYTLSPLPPLLRDGAESSMAKYYVVPSTSTTPYPTLPINFPNLAMYLQSAVQDSRRAANDSSSGMRRLANYIDNCYPNDSETAALDQGGQPRRGVGGMLKRVIGRGKGSKGSRGNEEIYDLVTPFVADEWG
ncbi:hypothetical protein F5I97DRAFT_859728 [Phlebopus sp. FC_14]|nr:hypothetical protein F5I97DRAFT_859728 [Phlebopus sp. FC_14]